MTGDSASAIAPRLMVLGAALLFSTGGAAIKACELDAWQIAAFRSGVAALFLITVSRPLRPLRDPRPWLVGVAYAATMLLYVGANKTTTAADSIFLQSTAPLYVMLLGPVLLREVPTGRDLRLGAVIAAGLLLVIGGAQSPAATAPAPAVGKALGAASGVTWALTLVGLRWLGRTPVAGHGSASVIAGNVLAFAAGLPFALPVAAPGAGDVALVLYLGVAQIGLAYILLTRGIRRVRAVEAALLLLAEPVLNPLWSWAAHGETPSWPTLAGGGLILAATAAHLAGGRQGSDPGRPNR
ncbi:MAG: DMT family transporter [Acidobacteria bacterium]|nr:MAG: DMT family transporter [Acidobacteriota bacterium]